VEKGIYRPSFPFRLDGREAALPRVLSLSGGERLNVIPAEARAAVAWLSPDAVEALCRPAAARLGVGLRLKETDAGAEIAVEGRAAHASMPELGVNALTALLELLAALPLAECGSTRALRRLSGLFPHGDGRGAAAGVAMEDEISGALTLAFTLLDMDSERIAGHFDARVPICATEVNCKRVVESKLAEAGFEVTGEMSPPHHTPADSPFVKTLLGAYGTYTGNRGECLSMGGGTYVHGIEGGVAFGAAMPGFEARPHGANERLNIKDLLAACKIFAQVIIDLCA
jgi:succinyl-diaminopimelate desuccinylase